MINSFCDKKTVWDFITIRQLVFLSNFRRNMVFESMMSISSWVSKATVTRKQSLNLNNYRNTPVVSASVTVNENSQEKMITG